MKRIIITEEQYKKYVFLNEEMGISDHVKKVSDEIYRRILAKEGEDSGDGNYFFVLENFDFIGYIYIFYYVLDMKTTVSNSRENLKRIQHIGLKNHFRRYSYNKNETVLDNKLINCEIHLNLVSENGKPLSNYFYDQIYHEVAHAFQCYSMYNNDNELNYDSDLYNFSIRNIANSNDYVGTICQMLYFTNDKEQPSFITGMYGDLINNKPKSMYEFTELYYSSVAYGWLTFGNETINEMNNWNWNDFLKSLYEYDIFKCNNLFYDKNKTIQYFKKKIERFKTKIDRVIYKAIQELNIKQ